MGGSFSDPALILPGAISDVHVAAAAAITKTKLAGSAWLSGTDVYYLGGGQLFNAGGVYALVTHIVLNHLPNATLRISFQMKCFGAGTTYGKIYRNGVAVGTERSTVDTANYTEYIENISGWAEGDHLELYGYNTSTAGNWTALRVLYNKNAPLTQATP